MGLFFSASCSQPRNSGSSTMKSVKPYSLTKSETNNGCFTKVKHEFHEPNTVVAPKSRFVRVVLVIWWGLNALEIINPVFLPSPWQTFRSFFGIALRRISFPALGCQQHQDRSSFFFLSILIAAPVGIASSQLAWVARLVHASSCLHPLPSRGGLRSTLHPLVWHRCNPQKDRGYRHRHCLSVITLAFRRRYGVGPGRVDRDRTHSRPDAFSDSAPDRPAVVDAVAIWDDLRISAGWAWSYLVLAELVAGNRGSVTSSSSRNVILETDRVFAAILLVGLLGAVTDFLFRFFQTRLFRWL